MVLDLVVTYTDDGFNAEVPSLKDCESWAHTEKEVIDKTIELLRFYLNLSLEVEIKIDKAYNNGTKKIYKIIFDKDQ